MTDEAIRSTYTRLLFGKEARSKLYAGLDAAAKAVECTLGPKGKTVVIAKNGEQPIVTKDGVTVIKSINLKDHAERIGANILREAATHTNETAGDGTTTSTVLTHALVREGLSLLDSFSSKEICHTFERLLSLTLDDLRKQAKSVTSIDEIADVASISANNDKEIGGLIAQAIERVGSNGIVTVEDAKGMTTSLTFVEGMQLDRGYISPYFVNNNERMNVTYTDVRVLVTDKKISTMQDVVPLLERSIRERFALFVVAEDVEGEALKTLIVNKMNNNLNVVAVRAPTYGSYGPEFLNDLCTFTGATLISSATGLSLKDANTTHLGSLKKLVVDAKSSLMVATPTSKERIDAAVGVLRAQLADVTVTKAKREHIGVRIARLSAAAGIINVGGATDVEIVEKKYRIEDALNATRAAVAEGILCGGGTALLKASSTIVSNEPIVIAFKRALQNPIRTICENAGVSADVVLHEMLKNGLGYNAATDTYIDMWKAGIIDPLKVTRSALENAVSVAITFLSMDAAVVEE